MILGLTGTIARIALAGLAIGAAFGALTILAGARAAGPETLRKLAHVAIGLVALSFAWLFEQTWPVALLCLGGLCLAFAMRVWTPFRRSLAPVVHGVERRSFGDYCIPIVIPILHAMAMPDRTLYAVPVLVLAIADAAAALVGTRLGRWPYRTDEGRKTVEGSLTLGATTGLIVLIALSIDGATPARAAAVGAVIALLITLAEAVSWRGMDNLILPVGTFALLKIYEEMPLEIILTRLLVGAVLVSAAVVWHRRAGLIGAAGLAVALVIYAAWAIGGWSWTVPPLAVMTVLPLSGIVGQRTPERDKGVGVVLSMSAVPLAWLFTGNIGAAAGLFAPYAAACSSAAGVLAIVRYRADRAIGGGDRLPARVAAIAVTVALASAMAAQGERPWQVFFVCLGSVILGVGLASSCPLEHGDSPGERRWLARTAIVLVSSLVGLVPMALG